MLKLIQFPPVWGLPDASPFVVKAQVLLKLAGLDFVSEATPDPRRGPKGKLPALVDDGRLIGDSEIIRWHIETKYGVDFDRGLSPQERALAHAVCRMLEERTYWAIVYSRWIEAANWALLRDAYFGKAPALVRWLLVPRIRNDVRRTLRGQGLGRHSAAEIYEMGVRDIRALAAMLGDKPYFMGPEPTGADATVFAFMNSVLRPPVESPLKEEGRRHANLVDYEARMRARYYA